MNTQIANLLVGLSHIQIRTKMIAVIIVFCMLLALTLAPAMGVLAGPIDGGPDRIAFAINALPTL